MIEVIHQRGDKYDMRTLFVQIVNAYPRGEGRELPIVASSPYQGADLIHPCVQRDLRWTKPARPGSGPEMDWWSGYFAISRSAQHTAR